MFYLLIQLLKGKEVKERSGLEIFAVSSLTRVTCVHTVFKVALDKERIMRALMDVRTCGASCIHTSASDIVVHASYCERFLIRKIET